MQVGIDFASGDITTKAVSSDRGGLISSVILLETGLTETINEGEANAEETFGNCIETLENRMSSHMGISRRLRTFCAGIGLMSFGQVSPDGFYNVKELVDYTAQ